MTGKSLLEIAEERVLIVAELSANHGQNLDIAVKSIQAAKEAGADAVKLQTYTPDTITIKSDKSYFRINQGTIWDGTTLYDLYERAYTPWEWHSKLKSVAEDLGMVCFSAPFDKSAVDFLEALSMPAYKIASMEVVDIPLIRYVASKGKPVIVSTGIATESEIVEAVQTCREAGNNQIAILKCTSEYPTPLVDVNLNTIPDMRSRFNTMVGVSDHTLGIEVPIAAVAVGARIVEKHFILDKSIGGPDASFSMEKGEFKRMVDSIRMTEQALGQSTYELSDRARRSREHSRSLFVVEDMKKGELFSEKNLRSIRPGFGLHPRYYDSIIGRKALLDISRGTPLSWEMISE